MRNALSLCCFLLSILTANAGPDGFGMTKTEVTCSLRDAEGFLWYGGRGTGLCRYDGYETESFRSDRLHPDLLRSNDVLCIAEQKSRAAIWFGTKEGAYILSKKDFALKPVVVRTLQDSSELADKRIACMLAAPDGTMWLTYRNQLLHMSADAKLLERFETAWEGKNRSILSVSLDADGTLWAGLWHGGVVCLKLADGKRQMVNGDWSRYPGSRREQTEEETKEMLDSVMSRQMTGKDTVVLSWVRTASGACYVGTYHSLYGYDGQKMRLLQGDLDKVRSMAYSEPSQSLYLLSRSRGVCRWYEGRLTVLLDSTQFRTLRLQGDSALLLSEGVAGVRMFNLKTGKIAADTTTTEVSPVATAYDVDGHRQPVAFGQERLTLPKGTDFVEICLSTLDFEHASQVQFAYRLNDGGAWTLLPEGEHVVKITRLPAGNTRLLVRATDELGRWSAPVEVLTIVRPALWYEHVWLWVVFAFVVLGVGYMLVRKAKKTKTPELNGDAAPQALPVADQEFLDKAVAAVSGHMTDSDYSVDALAADLCMSRANLHRKMRAITGQTPTDFIRNQRLERAAQMLRTTSCSVNEIADLVGFSYASYFTKCFKEKYGVMPKDYRT